MGMMTRGLLIAVALAGPASAGAQVSAFRYRPDANPSGLLLHYRKSNLDGSHPADIHLFLAGPDRLESFKASKGDTIVSLVKAWMDPTRFTVRRFESWRVSTGTRKMLLHLDQAPGADTLLITLGNAVTRTGVSVWPWHSYDFDLASLGWSFRHLVNPEGKFRVGITDPKGTATGVVMEEFGWVDVTFVRRERWQGKETRRYTIDGPGLEQRGGTLWVNVADGFLAGFEIQKPDEEGFTSGKLVLAGVEKMTEAGWLDYQKRLLTP